MISVVHFEKANFILFKYMYLLWNLNLERIVDTYEKWKKSRFVNVDD